MATDADQIASTQRTLASLDRMYSSIKESARYVALLYGQGLATCRTVRDYNLMALATYNAQKALLASLRTAGVYDYPAAPPTPTLFVWNGVTGDQAIAIKCATPLAGAFGRSLGADPSAPMPSGIIPPGTLSVSTSDPNWQNPDTAPKLVPTFNGELGDGGITLLLIGLAIVVGVVAVLEISKAIEQQGITERFQAQATAQAETYTTLVKARAGCMSECLARGNAQSDCTTSCSRLIPEPTITPMDEGAHKSTGYGTLALIGVASLAALGTIGYIKFKHPGGVHHHVEHELPDEVP